MLCVCVYTCLQKNGARIARNLCLRQLCRSCFACFLQRCLRNVLYGIIDRNRSFSDVVGTGLISSASLQYVVHMAEQELSQLDFGNRNPGRQGLRKLELRRAIERAQRELFEHNRQLETAECAQRSV